MSVDSLEDRIHRLGKYEEFTRAVEKFLSIPLKRRISNDEMELYDSITNCGGSSEEADEYINLLAEGGE